MWCSVYCKVFVVCQYRDVLHVTYIILSVLAYGKVFLVRKLHGSDHGKLYAMKVLKKATIVQKTKTTEHIKTERQVLEAIREAPFLITLHYAFQTDAKLHLILGNYLQWFAVCVNDGFKQYMLMCDLSVLLSLQKGDEVWQQFLQSV
jgi:serine/threonine protein kinase